jgi:superfamily II DNA or RNA helicase
VNIRNLDPAALDLWPHQLDAVRVGDHYFSSGSKRAGLIHMPTGTGKTGIMAVLATRRCKEKPVLVVCPSSALAHQLRQEFQSAFWQKIGASALWRPDAVLELMPSSLSRLVKDLDDAQNKRVIVVGTIQALQQVHAAGDAAKLDRLFGTYPAPPQRRCLSTGSVVARPQPQARDMRQSRCASGYV